MIKTVNSSSSCSSAVKFIGGYSITEINILLTFYLNIPMNKIMNLVTFNLDIPMNKIMNLLILNFAFSSTK